MNDQQFIAAMCLGAAILFLVWMFYQMIKEVAQRHNIRVPGIIDPNIGKALVSFDSTNDQGLMRDFQYAGVIVEQCNHDKYYPHIYFYKVKVLVSKCERVKEGEIKEVPAWYCDKSKEIVIHID